MDTEVISVASLPPVADVVAQIRHTASLSPDRAWAWVFVSGTAGVNPAHEAALTVGVRGQIGALRWSTGSGITLVPQAGVNTHPVVYRLAGRQERLLPPGAEVGVEVVYRALTEFVNTRGLPECLGWRPAPVGPWNAGWAR
ncbi:MAG TPA: Imm1 family immunity protein [Pseudonocardiaceae bacterium]|nr:Imm1 family immunity protein [Pseudonocardiaceae bacterium]